MVDNNTNITIINNYTDSKVDDNKITQDEYYREHLRLLAEQNKQFQKLNARIERMETKSGRQKFYNFLIFIIPVIISIIAIVKG